MAVALGLHAVGLVYVLHRLAKGERRHFQLAVSRIKAGEGQKILYNMGHPVALGQDDAQEIFLHIRRDLPALSTRVSA